MESVTSLIERLQLKPHPEGGWYREVYRSANRVSTPRGTRSALTTICYLLEEQQSSRWHVVESDEIWHFYGGAPLELLVFEPQTGAFQRNVLGPSSSTQQPVGIVSARTWQAARSLGAYSLMGCSVGPGFEFEDFRFVSALPDHARYFVGEMSGYRTLL